MPQHEEPGKQRGVYTIPNMEQATVKKNITYKTVDGLDLQMDMYYAPDFQEGALRPAVIFIHGDPPERVGHSKDMGQYISWGLIAVAFNHRTSERLTKVYDLSSRPGEIAPLFIARAGLDYPELNESIDQFVSEAPAHNISLSLMNHPLGQHGFDVRDDNARS